MGETSFGSTGQEVRLKASACRPEFKARCGQNFRYPPKKSPRLSRLSQSTGNGPAHSQGNGSLCKGGTRCSGVFSACVRRSSSLSTKLRGLSAHRRPSFFYMRSPSWASNPKKHCRLNSEIQCDFIIRVTFELQCEFLTHISVIWWLHETAILMMIGAVKA